MAGKAKETTKITDNTKQKGKLSIFKKLFGPKEEKKEERVKPDKKQVKGKSTQKKIVKKSVKATPKKIVKVTKAATEIRKTEALKKKIKTAEAKPAKIKVKAIKIKTKPKKKKEKKNAIDFLENREISDYLHNLVGLEGMAVVKRIAPKEVSDVDLADTMDLKANIIRKHLYAMYEAGVVTYRRHRSKTGWYTYFWKLHPERIANAINLEREKQVKELMEVLEYEKNNHFYQCKNRCTRVVFDEASDLAFRCARCSEPLEHHDNAPYISDIESRISKLRGS